MILEKRTYLSMIQKTTFYIYIIRTSELIGEIPNLLDWNPLKFDSELFQLKISEKGTDFISKFKLLVSYWLKLKYKMNLTLLSLKLCNNKRPKGSILIIAIVIDGMGAYGWCLRMIYSILFYLS